MKHKIVSSALFALALVFCLALMGCAPQTEDPTTEDLSTLKDLREVSWEGKELTVKVGENKTTDCNWRNEFQDDTIVGYSTNRKFTLSDVAAKQGVSAGVLSMGFEGKSGGTTRIYCTSDKDWDGNKPGYKFEVIVTVNDDGTIDRAAVE